MKFYAILSVLLIASNFINCIRFIEFSYAENCIECNQKQAPGAPTKLLQMASLADTVSTKISSDDMNDFCVNFRRKLPNAAKKLLKSKGNQADQYLTASECFLDGHSPGPVFFLATEDPPNVIKNIKAVIEHYTSIDRKDFLSKVFNAKNKDGLTFLDYLDTFSSTNMSKMSEFKDLITIACSYGGVYSNGKRCTSI